MPLHTWVGFVVAAATVVLASAAGYAFGMAALGDVLVKGLVASFVLSGATAAFTTNTQTNDVKKVNEANDVTKALRISPEQRFGSEAQQQNRRNWIGLMTTLLGFPVCFGFSAIMFGGLNGLSCLVGILLMWLLLGFVMFGTG